MIDREQLKQQLDQSWINQDLRFKIRVREVDAMLDGNSTTRLYNFRLDFTSDNAQIADRESSYSWITLERVLENPFFQTGKDYWITFQPEDATQILDDSIFSFQVLCSKIKVSNHYDVELRGIPSKVFKEGYAMRHIWLHSLIRSSGPFELGKIYNVDITPYVPPVITEIKPTKSRSNSATIRPWWKFWKA